MRSVYTGKKPGTGRIIPVVGAPLAVVRLIHSGAMVAFVMLTISSLALCLAPAVLLFLRARAAPVDADAYGWDLPQVRVVGVWYAGALIGVGTLTTIFLYWPLTILFLLVGAVAIGASLSIEAPVALSVLGAPGAAPPLLSADELAGRSRRRRLSIATAVLALGLGGLFAFTAATIASEELPGGHAAERSPMAVAAALIKAAPLDAALVGTVPEGSPQSGMPVAIVKTAKTGSDQVEYRIMTRVPADTVWSALEGVSAYSAAEEAIAAVTERFGIERFSLSLTGTADEPPPPGGTD